MSRSTLGFALAWLLAASAGGWLLSNDLVLRLLGLHDAQRAWDIGWRYVQALPLFAPDALQIKLSAAIGFGLPLLVWLGALISLFTAKPESLHGDASFAERSGLK